MNSVRTPLRVLMVDDHPVVREGLRFMLGSDAGLQVVGEASEGAEAVEMAARLEPDVVLVDIRMPGMSGMEVTRHIKAARPTTAVIVLTMYDSEMYVVEALRAGAAGYLVKDSSRELLCHTIRAVVDGGTTVRSSLLRQALQGLSRVPRQADGEPGQPEIVERLTTRELEVLRLVAQGHANREIARELNLAEVTVKKYVQSVIAKLGVSDRTLAAIAGVRLGLVE
ncbi:MAG: response regulator transcription factor [Chloroflexi bacterium]|nr:response regulator transcription factor [Chloroflexota bacterium]